MIIITGIGRCGTSLMAKFFHEVGFEMGNVKWFDPINAGYENKETLSINATLINKYVKGEKVNIYRVYADIYDLKFQAVKDPQFLTDARIIKHWWKVRKDIKVVFMHREPIEIVESMKRVPEWNTPVYRLFPEMIEQKNLEFLSMMEDLQIPFVKFQYPHFTGKDTINAVSKWVKLPDNALDTFNEIRE